MQPTQTNTIILPYANEFNKFSCTQSKDLGLLKRIEKKKKMMGK